jgi:undecaprenyl-diphosphatase
MPSNAGERSGIASRGAWPGAGVGAPAGIRGRVQSFRAAAGGLLSWCSLLALLAVAALAVLTPGVMAGRTTPFDEGVLRWMDGRAHPTLDRAALEVTALGDAVVVAAIALVAGTLLWLLGRRAYAMLLAAAVGGAWGLASVLKLVLDRPRPRVFEWGTHEVTSSSYPSGHATLSMVLLAALVYIIHRLSARRGTVIAALLVAGGAVLLVGASRLYLGVHYPSDVLAGYGVGFSWATVCALGMESIHRRRLARGASGGEEEGG